MLSALDFVLWRFNLFFMFWRHLQKLAYTVAPKLFYNTLFFLQTLSFRSDNAGRAITRLHSSTKFEADKLQMILG